MGGETTSRHDSFKIYGSWGGSSRQAWDQIGSGAMWEQNEQVCAVNSVDSVAGPTSDASVGNGEHSASRPGRTYGGVAWPRRAAQNSPRVPQIRPEAPACRPTSWFDRPRTPCAASSCPQYYGPMWG